MAVVHAPDPTADLSITFLAGYIVPNQGDTLLFLEEHPQLLPILDAAPRRVAQAFGKKLPLRLRLFRDQDDPACVELIVEILTGECGASGWAAGDLKLMRLHTQWLASLPRNITSNVLFVAEPA